MDGDNTKRQKENSVTDSNVDTGITGNRKVTGILNIRKPKPSPEPEGRNPDIGIPKSTKHVYFPEESFVTGHMDAPYPWNNGNYGTCIIYLTPGTGEFFSCQEKLLTPSEADESTRTRSPSHSTII